MIARATLITLASLSLAGWSDAQPAKTRHSFEVLVFSRTEGFRHQSIAGAQTALSALAQANDFEVSFTENAAAFSDSNLAGFDVVVFLNTTGDVLDPQHEAAFERFMNAGGGWVGIHSAADTEYDWEWYAGLVGAYFTSHPNNPNVRDGTIYVSDRQHPSTSRIPKVWSRTDEWYSYDRNPRGSVHVLATLDERSYDGGTMGADHPIAWCHAYAGGRAWYTGGGHTDEAFNEEEFRAHLLGGIQYAAGEGGDCVGTIWDGFEKSVLDQNTSNPIDLAVADDGRVFFVEKAGNVKVYDPVSRQTTLAADLPVFDQFEDGLLGVELDPDFPAKPWIYLFYSPEGGSRNVVSRFDVVGNQLDLQSEKELIGIGTQRSQCCHSAGSMAFDRDGNLYAATGDNTNPFESDGFAPLDERNGRSAWDAQRSSGSGGDLRGAIIRIKPEEDGTYTIPDGNLFPKDGSGGRPEIYVMGVRNPFRIAVDQVTGALYWGDVGPDAGSASSARGPEGFDEWNRTTESGNFGWPYCIADNRPYRDFDFATGLSDAFFDCDQPVNDSPNNAGPHSLPAAQPAWIWYPYGPSIEFPGVLDGSGRTSMGGPAFNLSEIVVGESSLPDYYDGSVFIYEWSRSWIAEVKLRDDGSPLAINPFLPNENWARPIAMELGPDGSLYMLEWGTGFGGDNADSRLVRVTYSRTGKAPILTVDVSPTSGPAPLEVSFSAVGSFDPDPGDFVTFSWDFETDGVVDAVGETVSHTYTEEGSITASLIATDLQGNTASRNWLITVGNTAPQVSIVAPVDGAFYAPGDSVVFEVSVVDAEDGSTAAGTIDCASVEIQVFIGHDDHSHPLNRIEDCSGMFVPIEHGVDADNLFYVVEAAYADNGGSAFGSITGRDQHVLQPKTKQAQYFTDGNGVELETTGDILGGGENLAFIDGGDWVSYFPMSFDNLDFVAFRVASDGSGGQIQIRAGELEGPIVAVTDVNPTGGWQTYTDLYAAVSPVDSMNGAFFRFLGSGGGLFNLNYFEVLGGGSAGGNPSVEESGLQAEYFDSIDLTGEPIKRIDPAIGFNWGVRAPIPGMGAERFSVRWSGRVLIEHDEVFRFFADTDDGVRVWLDGELIIDRWDRPPVVEVRSQSMFLDAGAYDFRVEYFENSGRASAAVKWESPSNPKGVIPPRALRPERLLSTATEQEAVPDQFAVRHVFPNPFQDRLVVTFDLPAADRVEMELIDVTGREVASLVSSDFAAGRYTRTFQIGELASGLYMLRLVGTRDVSHQILVHVN